jgi:hypothetical protein
MGQGIVVRALELFTFIYSLFIDSFTLFTKEGSEKRIVINKKLKTKSE